MNQLSDMTEGKRYRVVTTEEGTLTVDLPGMPSGYITTSDGRQIRLPVDFDRTTVELLPDPLPTTPGSVIHHKVIGHLIRMADYTNDRPWLSGEGDGNSYNEDEIRSATVLFDAGAK